MPSPLETVRTDVDLLVDLVKNKKEISFDDAAKELKLPVATVESWANFLDEEGIIAIKYKFTTPYLYYTTAAGKPGAVAEPAAKAVSTFEEKIKEIETLMENAFSHIKNGNYEMAENIYPALTQEIRTVHQLMKEKDTLNKLPLGEGVMEKLKEIDKVLEEAKELTEKGDYEKAREIYMQIHNEVKELIMLVKEMNVELINLYGEKTVLEQKKGAGEEEFDLRKINNVDELLKKAYEFLKAGEIDNARRVYDKIQNDYDELANEYRGRKEELNRNLLKLNKDLSLHIGKVSMKEIEEKDREISRLIKDVRSSLEKNSIPQAEKLYASLEESFKAFPTSFLERRLEIEKRILDLREEFIQKRRSFLSSELKQKGDEILVLLAKIQAAISSRDVKAAMEDYGKVKVAYSSLPQGFLNEKIELQEKIFEVYKKLIEINREVSQGDFLAKTEKIGAYIQKIEQLLSTQELSPVEDFLNKAYELFNQLPMGFLSEKTNIQDRLLRLSGRCADLKEKSAIFQFNDRSERIKKLFKTIEHYISNKEFDMAKEVYSEITNVYNQLPPGFFREKTELKTKILTSYKKLMLSSDETFLKDVNQATKDKYENLLRLLIQIHSHIDAGEFDLIEPNYQHVISLYNELPLGFLTKKIHIRGEITRVYDGLRLYSLTKEADAIIREKRYNQAIPVMNAMHELYHQLIETNADDVQLFRYVNERYSSYLNVMKLYAEEDTLVRRGVKLDIKPPVAPVEEPAEVAALPTPPVPVNPMAGMGKMPGSVAEPKARFNMPIEPIADAKNLEIKNKGFEPSRARQQEPVMTVHKFREAYNEALERLSKKDFAGASEELSAIEKSREWHSSAKPLSELIEHMKGAQGQLPDYIAGLVRLGMQKSKQSYEGKLVLAKIIRGLNNYFAGQTDSALKDIERIRQSYRNAPEVRQVIDFISSNPSTGAVARAEAETPRPKPVEAMEATGLARTAPELESTALRPSVENLLILRKLRRANEAFLHGDYDAAASDFQRVLEIDPLNQKAVDMLKKITLTGHSQ